MFSLPDVANSWKSSSNRRANVILLDEHNYSRYRAGLDFNYLGGYADLSPVVLQIPFSARWHLIVDAAGDPGTVRAAVRLVTSGW